MQLHKRVVKYRSKLSVKKNRMKKFSLSFVVLLMCPVLTFGQDKAKYQPYNNWEIGINAGVANFTGEYNMFKDARFNHFDHWKNGIDLGVGALVKKNFSHVFALELGWNYSNLTGSWKHDIRIPPISDFKTGVNEFDLNTVWNLSNLFSSNKFDRRMYWYVKLGLGATYLTEKVAVTPLSGKHWKLLTYPIGTGVAFRLNDNFKLNVGTQWSWINTDRLDGRRTDAVTMKPGTLVADIFGTKLYTSVGLSYTFAKKKKKQEPIIVAPIPMAVVEPAPEPKLERVPEVINVQPAVVNENNFHFVINFAFDKYNLDSKSSSELDRLVKDMIENPTVKVEVSAHTDSRGPATYNMKLSERRAKTVKDYLMGKGIDASRINVFAFGETRLLNKCADGVPCTEAEHAVNRRVETR